MVWHSSCQCLSSDNSCGQSVVSHQEVSIVLRAVDSGTGNRLWEGSRKCVCGCVRVGICVCVCVCSLLLGNPNFKDPYIS